MSTLRDLNKKRLVPQWGLGLVLSALKLPQFEPATEVDIKFVSYKCCFLLVLTSGGRRSEIHALSVSDSCLRFNRDQSAVILLTDPSFLGKNQIPSKGSKPILITALPSDSSSYLPCSIRILKIYLNKRRQRRSNSNSRLFLPLKRGISDLSSKSISTWLCNTMLPAYHSSGEQTLARHSVKAHEVRTMSSSWALFSSASMAEVLSAGFWRCQNSFIDHYLQSMTSHADNIFFLEPIIAAQRFYLPPVTTTSGDSAIC